jgi:hypothetical protein
MREWAGKLAKRFFWAVFATLATGTRIAGGRKRFPMRFLAVIGCFLQSVVLAADTGLTTREQLQEVRACLTATAKAASNEDLDAYIECFDPSLRLQIQRMAGLRFAQHEVSVAVIDSHVLTSTPTQCEVAVQYEATLSQQSYEIVSVLLLKRVGDAWKIRKETIRSAVQSSAGDTPFPYGCSSCASSSAGSRSGCSSGQCSLTGR